MSNRWLSQMNVSTLLLIFTTLDQSILTIYLHHKWNYFIITASHPFMHSFLPQEFHWVAVIASSGTQDVWKPTTWIILGEKPTKWKSFAKILHILCANKKQQNELTHHQNRIYHLLMNAKCQKSESVTSTQVSNSTVQKITENMYAVVKYISISSGSWST